jgi:hypothetical protein
MCKETKKQAAKVQLLAFYFFLEVNYFLPLAILVENSLPALNFGTLRALILITAPV